MWPGGSRPVSEKGAKKLKFASKRLKFGRREIEGDSANPEPPVLPDWGQLNSIGTRITFQAMAGPFACLQYMAFGVSDLFPHERTQEFERIGDKHSISVRCLHRPTEVGAAQDYEFSILN